MGNIPFTPQPTNGEDWAADNAACLRESLGLAVDATQEEVDSAIAADNAALFRESLGLPVDATREQVDETIAANNAALFREILGDTAIRQ